MASFPTVGISNPLVQKIRFKTLISSFDDKGAEQRKQKWLYPKRDFTLSYVNISKVNAATLWAFYIARGGSYGGFNFFLPEPATGYPARVGEYIGTGDGSTTVFNLPSKAAASVTVYLDAAEIDAGGVDYTFGSEGGTDGADKITMETAPAIGEVLTMDFTGVLKIRCRFKDDNMDFDTFRDFLVTSGIGLKGLLNE